MARPRITPDVLAQKGVPLKLAGDLDVTVCYTFKSLMLLEERYGSVQGAMQIVSNAEGAAFTSLAGILACGLTHEIAPSEPGVSGDGNLLSDPDLLGDYLEPEHITLYGEVMGQAFEKAFPNVGPQVPTDAPTPPVETNSSRGPSGTTSPESASVSAMASSGA